MVIGCGIVDPIHMFIMKGIGLFRGRVVHLFQGTGKEVEEEIIGQMDIGDNFSVLLQRISYANYIFIWTTL